VPEVRDMARENRAFLQRAVRFLVGEAGIRQIIDIGTGIPAAGNVHEVAREMAPDVRVIYVDNDPIVHVLVCVARMDSATASAIVFSLWHSTVLRRVSAGPHTWRRRQEVALRQASPRSPRQGLGWPGYPLPRLLRRGSSASWRWPPALSVPTRGQPHRVRAALR
jgi:S-adenosyl methyltransferase